MEGTEYNVGRKEISAYVFSDGDGSEYFRINKDGIFFNKEKYPQFTEEDFAKVFISTLENNYAIQFKNRESFYE